MKTFQSAVQRMKFMSLLRHIYLQYISIDFLSREQLKMGFIGFAFFFRVSDSIYLSKLQLTDFITAKSCIAFEMLVL